MVRAHSLRFIVRAIAMGLALALQAGPAFATPPMTKELQAAITPAAALQRLQEGNARFVANELAPRDVPARVKETQAAQFPFAIVLGCMDSRVPPEVVFDQGIGDIFSARIAGNIVEPALLGSIEFATKVVGAKLIFVLGHTDCGAVKGACDDVKMGNLTTTLSYLRPAVDASRDVPGPRSSKNAELVTAVTHANVKLTMEAIRKQSPIVDGLVSQGAVVIAGGIYDVATGKVTLIE